MITKSNVETVTQVVDNIKESNTQNPNASLSLQVLNDVEVSTNNESITIESNKQTQINRLYEEALAAAAAEAAAILAAKEAAAAVTKKAAAAVAAAAVAAEEAAAAVAAAILAAEEAAAAAAAEEEAVEEEEAAEAAAAAAAALARANNLTARCNAAKANVLGIKGRIITATANKNEAEEAESAALILYNAAQLGVRQYVSPVTEEEHAELDQLRSTRDALKISYDISVAAAEDASITLTNLNITLATAIETRDTLCAQADAAQAAAE